LFFGLTRSYKGMVLPSLIENVLKPNARHQCDVYVHFYAQDAEPKGRNNNGGELRPNDIFLLEEAIHSVSSDYYENVLSKQEHAILPGNSRPEYRPPIIAFTHDTPDTFHERRSEQLGRYQNEEITTGKNTTVKSFFPWAAKTYTGESLNNIVKQWHAIETVFKLMDYSATQQKLSYTRVGMFRSDCLYVTPIDIASLGKRPLNGNNKKYGAGKPSTSIVPRYDVDNRYFVSSSFALYPVNDRMVYGPYEAVKVWATKRFDLVEEAARLQVTPGYTMHSERFLNCTIFPAMEAAGYEHASNDDVCFLRTRVGQIALVDDCSVDGLVPTSRTSIWNNPNNSSKVRVAGIASVLGRQCRLDQIERNNLRETMVNVVICED